MPSIHISTKTPPQQNTDLLSANQNPIPKPKEDLLLSKFSL